MGSEVLAALARASDMRPVGAVDLRANDDSMLLPDGSSRIPLASDLGTILERSHPQVVVDFSTAAACMAAARQCLPAGVPLVAGTTGLSDRDLAELDRLARERGVGVVVAPNFALGAVLLLHLAKQAARFFDYAELIEAHHEAKIDAPSGTALAIARAMLEARGRPFTRNEPEKEPLAGTRGGAMQGLSIHAMRMPGRQAHHEVVLGTAGQTLSLRHDVISRECYMPGVLMAVRQVLQCRGLVLGLDKLMGLS
ncbi:MAG: 4-hydroxy-tetrahydrodipicolinate reductase [Chloroflexi bacterium]|nr:4-hydroxy-tetrahydrodipicolinate reductase [Chloroflexota bacterium]